MSSRLRNECTFVLNENAEQCVQVDDEAMNTLWRHHVTRRAHNYLPSPTKHMFFIKLGKPGKALFSGKHTLQSQCILWCVWLENR
ncbi:unnamed protein product [Caenorhabditis brenneri]